MTAEGQKQAAGEAAADLAMPGMLVGLGTGSTARFFVKALAARTLPIRCVATSSETRALAESLGLTVIELDQAGPIDLTVDGADEIGPGLSLIKGAGGALLHEKLVWMASKRCVVIADQSKLSAALGRAPLPIEIIPFGRRLTVERVRQALRAHGITAAAGLRTTAGTTFRTDSGNVIYDVAAERIDDPQGLGDALKLITGVVEHGLFLNLASEALIAETQGVRTLHP